MATSYMDAELTGVDICAWNCYKYKGFVKENSDELY